MLAMIDVYIRPAHANALTRSKHLAWSWHWRANLVNLNLTRRRHNRLFIVTSPRFL